MGNLTKKAMRFKMLRLKNALEDVVSVLHEEHGDEIPKEKVLEMLDGHIESLEASLSEILGNRNNAPWDFSKEKNEPVFVEDESVCLKYMTEDYKAEYLRLEKQIITMYPRDDKEAEYWEKLWEDTRAEHEFDVAIIRKSDGIFVGYIGIKNTRNELWEIAIELLEEYTVMGYGTSAMTAFMKKVAEITGKREFQVKVESDNTICQRMLGHHNAELIGICDYVFSDEKDAADFETENLDLIDDNMVALANQLKIEPRKLLSHVLEYRVKA